MAHQGRLSSTSPRYIIICNNIMKKVDHPIKSIVLSTLGQRRYICNSSSLLPSSIILMKCITTAGSVTATPRHRYSTSRKWMMSPYNTNLSLGRYLSSTICCDKYQCCGILHQRYQQQIAQQLLPIVLQRTNRHFSSNQLLGHSPMSHNSSNSIMNPGGSGAHMGIAIPDSTYIPTAYEAVIGNVWQTSTWRRDKLLELKGELNTLPEVLANPDEKVTLDFLATDRQKLDLYLVDGVHLIIKHVEQAIPLPTLSSTASNHDGYEATVKSSVSPSSSSILSDLVQRMEQKIIAETGDTTCSIDHLLSESEWNRILLWLQKEIETVLSTTTKLQPAHIYHPVRDYINLHDQAEKLLENEEFLTFVKEHQIPSKVTSMGHETVQDDHVMSTIHCNSVLQHPHVECYHNSVIRYQLLLTLAITQQLQQSWKVLTTLTDQDIDRAAATLHQSTDTAVSSGSAPSSSLSIPVKKLLQVMKAYLSIPTNGSDIVEVNDSWKDQRLDALWSLIDKDNDGLIDQVEMNQICTMAVSATKNAIRQFVMEVLDVVPLDHQPPTSYQDNDINSGTTMPIVTKKIGWRQRRRMRNEKAAFLKRLNDVLQYHFDNELEMSHRLRCIYSWSNKQHQNNRINSILVQEDNTGIVTKCGWSEAICGVVSKNCGTGIS